MIEANESEDEFEGLSNLKTPYDSDFDSESEFEDEESVDVTHLLQRKTSKKANKITKNTVAKATVQFSLGDEKGKKENYLGLLDTGSTASLMSEELVKKFKL